MDKRINYLKNNGLRIHVTPYCNYNCYFCHNEGQEKSSTQQVERNIIPLQVITKFIDYGIYNYTLTGGEPLLYKKQVIDFFTELIKLYPEIIKLLNFTIVTNGFCLDDDCIDFFSGTLIKHLKNFKLNISLHTIDEELYNEATGTKNRFPVVINNIKKAVKNNIKVKLNYVLLKSKNSKEDYLERIIEFSKGLGIDNIKFIEMLITELNKDFYYDFYDIQTLIYNMKHRAEKIESDLRKTTYYFKDREIAVDLIRVTCTIGCNLCFKNREIELSGNSIKPCFMQDSILLPEYNEIIPEELFVKSLKIIENMAIEHGTSSPSLIYRHKPIPERVIFKVDIAPDRFKSIAVHYPKSYYEYKIRTYFHPFEDVINNRFTFYLEIPEQSPDASKIIASKRELYKSGNYIAMKEIFLDRVYDFARSRLNVCENKLKAMGYIQLKEEAFSADILQLKKYEKKDESVLLKQIKNNNQLEYLLEIYSEDVNTIVMELIKELDLKILDFEDKKVIISLKLKELTEKNKKLYEYIKNEYNAGGKDFSYIHRVLENCFRIYIMENIKKVDEEYLFISALLCNISSDLSASEAETIKILEKFNIAEEKKAKILELIKHHSHNYILLENKSTELKLLQDGIYMEYFNIFHNFILYLPYSKDSVSPDKNKHKISEYLKATHMDFNFDITKKYACKGWYIIKYLGQGRDIPEKPLFL